MPSVCVSADFVGVLWMVVVSPWDSDHLPEISIEFFPLCPVTKTKVLAGPVCTKWSGYLGGAPGVDQNLNSSLEHWEGG